MPDYVVFGVTGLLLLAVAIARLAYRSVAKKTIARTPESARTTLFISANAPGVLLWLWSVWWLFDGFDHSTKWADLALRYGSFIGTSIALGSLYESFKIANRYWRCAECSIERLIPTRCDDCVRKILRLDS